MYLFIIIIIFFYNDDYDDDDEYKVQKNCIHLKYKFL